MSTKDPSRQGGREECGAAGKTREPERGLPLKQLIRSLRRRYPYRSPVALGAGHRPALLIVDFIRAFTDPASPLAGSWEGQIKATNRLLEQARPAGCPVFFSCVNLEPEKAASWLLCEKTPELLELFSEDSWGELDPRLSRDPGDKLVLKEQVSAFFGTDLAHSLRKEARDTLLICGCVTSGCVRASVVDACQHGFRPIVIREAVGDRSLLAQEANLLDISLRYGDVWSLRRALAYLEGLVDRRGEQKKCSAGGKG